MLACDKICAYIYFRLNGQPGITALAQRYNIPPATMSAIASHGNVIKLNGNTMENFARALGMSHEQLIRHANALADDQLLDLHFDIELPEEQMIELLAELQASSSHIQHILFQKMYAKIPEDRLDRITKALQSRHVVAPK